MFKVNNKDTRTTPGVVLVSLLITLTCFTPSSVSIINFEHVISGWDNECMNWGDNINANNDAIVSD